MNSALGAAIGLILSIILIVRKVSPFYSMRAGAVAGGLLSGFGLAGTVGEMIAGVEDITPAILRILAAGVLSGALIITGAASSISDTIMKKLGMLEPIDLNKIPNAANISSFTLEKAAFDPEMEYSVPYYMGAAGIAVNKTKVSDYNRDWSIFEDERYKDRMVMLNDVREVLGDALIHLGYSANSKNPEELKAAEDLVVNKWKPNLVKFDAESFAKGFASGEYWIAHGYSEGFFQEIGSREKWNETVDFFIPQEGGAMYIDCFCILKGSKNVDLAHEFINFFHRPEIYAEFLDYFKFPATVNPGAAAYMKEEPVYTAEALANCQIKEDLAEALPMYSQTWERIRLY